MLSNYRQNRKANRIYRVTRSFNNKEGIVPLHLGAVAPPFGPLLKNEFPDIQKVTRVLLMGTAPMHYKDKIFNEKEIFCADSNFMSLFDVSPLKGDPSTALNDPYCVVLTEKVAKKYFGEEDPMNKIIRLNNQINFRVTGIFKPFPSAAHLHPEIMLSFNTLKDSTIYGEKNLQTNWGNNAFYTYLLFPKDYPVKHIEAQFPYFLDKYMREPGEAADYKHSKYTQLFLQKLTDIHLTSHLDEEIEENGDRTRVYIFGAIALFILLIACINYMNLSTARSALRAKEIGIRKVAGAQRGEIITQFLSESVMITYMAIILAVGLTYLTLPWLNAITGQALSIHSIIRWQGTLPLLLTPFVIGILSGIYPALFMSSFQPAKVLKGLFKVGSGSISFRKVLVVTQFSISIILIISTAIVFQQLHYMQQKSLGFNKDRVVTLRYDNGLDKTYEAFRNDLRQYSDIKDATRSSRIPGGRLLDEQGASTESGDSLKPASSDIKYLTTDHDFVTNYAIPMAAGRHFSPQYAAYTTSFLLNVAATQALGMRSPQEAIGKNFKYGDVKGKVIGVITDFHFESLHQNIVPLVLVMPPARQAGNSYGRISVKIAGNDLPAAIAHLEKTWKKFLPETPFEYTFLDEQFDQLYRSEQNQGTPFTTFACIALFITSRCPLAPPASRI